MGNNDTQARLHQAIDYLKDIGVIHKQQDIAEALHISKSGVSQMLKGSGGYSIEQTARRFARAYPRISADWLLTGEGAMVLPDTHTQRPHYGGHVAAGAWDIAPIPAEADTWRDLLNIAPDYDFTATATGDSMLPLIHSGDTLYCRRLYRGDPLRSGSVYLFATADGTLVKQLLLPTSPDADLSDTSYADHIPYDDHLGTLTLHSLNPDYADIELSRQDLIGIAKVVATFHPLGADIADHAPGHRPGTPTAHEVAPEVTPEVAPDPGTPPDRVSDDVADDVAENL
mgnify:CR=1 FL=1